MEIYLPIWSPFQYFHAAINAEISLRSLITIAVKLEPSRNAPLGLRPASLVSLAEQAFRHFG